MLISYFGSLHVGTGEMWINITFALLTKYKKSLKDFNVKGSKIIFKGYIKYFVSHKDHLEETWFLDNEFLNIIGHCEVWGMGFSELLLFFFQIVFFKLLFFFFPTFSLFLLPFSPCFFFSISIFWSCPGIYSLILSKIVFIPGPPASFIYTSYTFHFFQDGRGQQRCWFLGRFFLTHYIAFKSIEIEYMVTRWGSFGWIKHPLWSHNIWVNYFKIKIYMY